MTPTKRMSSSNNPPPLAPELNQLVLWMIFEPSNG